MNPWQALERELDLWPAPPTMWWRDDDAIAPTAALERLLTITADASIALQLAVIPALCTTALAQRLADETDVWVLQHGWDHRGYAAPGERKRELGGPRPRNEILQQLKRGRALLAQQFADRALDILVPPWNRIDADLLPALPQLGYRRLSVLGPRPAEPTDIGRINVHIDIIDWKSRRFAGEASILQRLTGHLEARRLGTVDASEPTGVMTHHLDQDEDCWRFLAALTDRLSGRVRWIGGPELLEA
ncbi:polysaccharide deacetylase [Marinobacterium nitratireducens]|uniref:Polysaccharide deacetylase n=1 Tax=Marinobacterium nitratireducens TaxID=518897 RepID=A0A917ZE03_9GAMM|nr:polysaccharide deacetylase family protein [Marinobacterium nitratireducens]GGO81083.1 polysaccharide deacetylase [Marinobacterium nitratireducens]